MQFLTQSLPFHFLAAGDPLEHVVDHPIIVTEGGWWVLTNHMIILCVSAVLMLIIFPLITRPYRDNDLVPTGTRNFFEAIMMFLRNDVARPILGEQTDRFMPFLWTLFFFILFNNLIGLLPLDVLTNPLAHWLMGPGAHSIYGTPTANIWVTGTLATIAFITIQAAGIRANGLVNYSKHFLGGAPWYMFPVMIPVEFLGMVVKPVALAIRLMANMTAGHILVAVIVGFTGMAAGLGYAVVIGIGVPVVIGGVAIMCLELFVACLQAYIFTFLTCLFIGQLVVHEHDEHEHAEHHDEAHESIGGGDLRDHAELNPPQAPGHAAAH
jgi:F-type H+-transporting ATPase subunit a